MYATKNHEIGYIQGMNYLAGMIFLQFKADTQLNLKMVEEECFIILTILMEEYGLAELYSNGFDKLCGLIKVIEQKLEQHVPDFNSYFPKGVSVVDIFITQWVITLFTADLPLDSSAYLLDMLVVHGWKFLVQAIIG